jgi:hypothetical protein
VVARGVVTAALSQAAHGPRSELSRPCGRPSTPSPSLSNAPIPLFTLRILHSRSCSLCVIVLHTHLTRRSPPVASCRSHPAVARSRDALTSPASRHPSPGLATGSLLSITPINPPSCCLRHASRSTPWSHTGSPAPCPCDHAQQPQHASVRPVCRSSQPDPTLGTPGAGDQIRGTLDPGPGKHGNTFPAWDTCSRLRGPGRGGVSADHRVSWISSAMFMRLQLTPRLRHNAVHADH